MKTRDGYKMSYNIQTGVDNKYKMITYANATQKQNDLNILSENIKKQVDEINLKPCKIVADSGYYSALEVTNVKSDKNMSCFIAIPDKWQKSDFIYDENNDTYTCIEGKILSKSKTKRVHHKKEYYEYKCLECKDCSSKIKCGLKENSKYKRLTIGLNISQKEVDNFKKDMKTEKAKSIIRKRKEIVEHPYGTIKRWFGKLGFIVTGLKNVQTEINLVTTAYNVRRLLNVQINNNLLFEQLELYFNFKNIEI